ncbi:MAG TPA: HYR domain-containing protein, partial [Chitinophagales bacterium]|nr:HYR domain-containing protein [Chitinophagales bacterium]
SNSVTLTVTDVNGNQNQCTATVTVEDKVIPVVNCQNATVQLDGTGNSGIILSQVHAGSSDACGITNVVAGPMTFTCSNVGTNTVTVTATDTNGNTNSCTATVTVQDLLPPAAMCQTVTVQLDASGNGSTTAAAVNNNSTDNCGIQSVSLNTTTFTCANVGSNPVTLTVTDVNGNSSSCSAMVMVQDPVPPTALCQNVTVQLGANGSGSATAAAVNNGSTDACGIGSLQLSQTDFTCAHLGSNTVTLYVTDANNNQSTCTATVTVVDSINPTALCQNATVQLDNSGAASVLAAQVNNGSTDNCGSPLVVVSPNTFTCANLGSNTVTLTATDGSGNSSACNATVTVADNVPPVANCKNAAITLNSNGTATITGANLNNGSTDNCTVTTLTPGLTMFTCAYLGANSVTLTVADQSGNTAACLSTVTVSDNLAPSAVCQSATVQLDATGAGSLAASAVNNGSSDNCTIMGTSVSPNNFNCTHLGSAQTVTLTVTDQSGNTATCSASVNVVDNINPTALCKNATVQLNSSGTATLAASAVNNNSADNCGISGMSVSPNAFGCANVGANTVTLTLTDTSNNTATCNATVTVQDVTLPQALCKNATVQLSSGGTASITTADINNGSNDACGIQNLSLNTTTFTCANVGPNPVILTVTDVNGLQSACSATVTVIDPIAPVANCKPATVTLNTLGQATLSASAVNNNSTDNCAVTGMSVSPASFNCTHTGNTQTVTLTVTDQGGNTATCTANVTVQDMQAPSVSCKNATVQLNGSGMAALLATSVHNGSGDNCGTPTLSVSPGAFSCSNLGANTVTLMATDGSGNTATCSATVTVQDPVAPVAQCQGASVTLSGGTASITAAQINAGSTDNCTVANMTVSPNAFTCAHVGNQTVTLTVTDQSGNTGTCLATVTVGPMLSATASSNSPVCLGGTIELTATGGVSYQWSGPNGFSGSGATPTRTGATGPMGGLYVVTVTAAGGCTTVLSTSVVVQSNPTTGISGTTNLCAGGAITLTASGGTDYQWAGPAGFSGIGQTISISNATTANGGAYTVTATNAGGCSATASANVTVNSAPNATAGGPAAVCVGNSISLTSSGGTSYLWNGPASFSSTLQNPVRTGATLAMSGTYHVTVTNSTTGCSATAGHTVAVNSPPVANATSNSPVCVGETLQLMASGGATYQWSGPSGFTSALQNPTRTPVVAGTYTVTVSAGVGCSSTKSISVTTAAKPTVSVSGSTAICAGVTLTLTATTGMASYSWSGPNGFTGAGNPLTIPGATTLNSGTYVVTVTNAAGCTNSASRTVTVNPLPVATAGNNTPICTGSTINLTSSGGTSYQWSGPGGYVSTAQNPVRTGATLTMAGTYTVTVTGTGGCKSTANTVVVVNSCTPLTVSSSTVTANSSTTTTPNGAITLNVTGGIACSG